MHPDPTPTPSADSPSPDERPTVGADVVHVVLSEIAWSFDEELAERNAGVIRDATPTVEDACRGLEQAARLLNEGPRFARRHLNDRVG